MLLYVLIIVTNKETFCPFYHRPPPSSWVVFTRLNEPPPGSAARIQDHQDYSHNLTLGDESPVGNG